jgi:3-dehydroquinate dehydratase/shikimate dehydrogenase
MNLQVDPICVVIGRTRHGMMQAEIGEAAKLGAGLIELRLDYLKKAPDLSRLLADKPCPMIATVRRPPDGGKWDDTEDKRRMVLRQAIVGGFDWVDLETDIADSIPRFGSVRRIVSYHNFREFPKGLEAIHEQMSKQDADVLKIVVRAQSPADNMRILSLIPKSKIPTIAYCMGDMGFPSRILQAKYGAPFTYAAFNKERNIAPGMPSFLELKRLYRYHTINAQTRFFGVIGDPVGHSLSPLIYNAAFAALQINAAYVPCRVPRDTLPAFLETMNQVPFEGYSVTIPHKEAAAALASQREEAVERCKAANTLARREGGFAAYNTDASGVLATFREILPTFKPPKPEPSAPGSSPHLQPMPIPPEPAQIAGRVVLILGAGGMARAAAHALSQAGALVVISNRTPERARELAHEIGARHVDWNARHSVLCDTVINCTSIGMHPNVDESPLHHSFFKPGLVVFDTVYTPETTLLIKEARERDCSVITGVELFIRQAAAQFKHFFGQPPPADLFRRAVRRALSPVQLRDEDEV